MLNHTDLQFFLLDQMEMMRHVLTHLLCLVLVCSAHPQPGGSSPETKDDITILSETTEVNQVTCLLDLDVTNVYIHSIKRHIHLCFPLSNVKSDQTSFVSGQLELPTLFLFAKGHNNFRKNISEIYCLYSFSQNQKLTYISSIFDCIAFELWLGSNVLGFLPQAS